jgi:hypothetical protein
MKKLLILYPNWVPSNAVGVQRARLIVNHLKQLNWEPVIIAVHPSFYEEQQAPELAKLVNKDIRVEYVNASQPKGIRIYGDIALRAFSQLRNKAIRVIQEEQVDAMWVPIPPFYTAIIGRLIHNKTGVPYVVDYIDPWVHPFPGSNKILSRGWIASIIAKVFEPFSVRKASALTGVSAAYFEPVLQRNPHLKGRPNAGMPYGFDQNDYNIMPENTRLLWADDNDVIPFVYAGAFLPKAHYFVEQLFSLISKLKASGNLEQKIRFYFVGTLSYTSKSITAYAKEAGIADIVKEHIERISYLEVLNNLSNAAGVLAIGSTESHYTASKIFQALLSGKPVFALFHRLSTIVKILEEVNGDNYLVTYDPTENSNTFEEKMEEGFKNFLSVKTGWSPSLEKLEPFSAKASAVALVNVLNAVVESGE